MIFIKTFRSFLTVSFFSHLCREQDDTYKGKTSLVVSLLVSGKLSIDIFGKLVHFCLRGNLQRRFD